LATRSLRRGTPSADPDKPRPATKSGARKNRAAGEKAVPSAPTGDIEEVAARAARLGITPERVLEEYARIAFADLRQFIEWGADGRLVIKDSVSLTAAEAAAVAEIVAGATGGTRVKLYDKKAALDAIARHLGMFPAAPRRREGDASPDPAEDAREVLERRLARLAARGAAT
jgi:phage terminase small subunit